MKKIIYIVFTVASLAGILSCVDDYQDANPPRLKDGPFFKVALSDGDVIGGEVVTFTINVIDAPGGIDSISISNPQKLGTYTINNLSAVQGKTTGEITGTFVSPTTYEGTLELNFEVFDGQLNDKGDDAKKGASVKKELNITFPDGASEFTISAPSSTFTRGTSFEITVEITSAPGGVDSVFATADQGEIAFNTASYNAIVGEESGTVTATYTADEEYVGDVVVTVSVVDMLQQRVSTKAIELSAEYEFAAPVVSLSIDETEFKAFNEIGLEVVVTALGTIDTVIIESFEVTSSGNGAEVGDPSLEESDLEDAVGTTSATIGGSFISDVKGFTNIKVTVIDTQGRSTSDSVEVLVLPCEKADLAGEYRVVTAGESADAPAGPYVDLVDTVMVTGAVGNMFNISDITFGLYELQGYDSESGSIVTCDDNIVAGEGESIIVTSGVINMDGTIEIEWESIYGDTGVSVLTPIP